ncbi:hypothetical protein tb265_11770 [Gemmatimonadetes bacterium T265]|nr:hypothetical protein tb265_11770 [Gemmatimonadetes bacterium T265]
MVPDPALPAVAVPHSVSSFMSAIRLDRPVDRPAGRRARTSFLAGALAALASVVAACSDSTGTGTTPKDTTCANYSCSVTATASVGDTVLFNVRVPGGAASDNVGPGTGACDAPNLVKSRVAAVSNHAVIVVDTRNPTNGLTDAYYATIAQSFDTLVWPVDTRHFGTPVDVDNNGRVIAYFTRAVNGLTPAHSQSYVGGFFYSRDLFPTVSKTIGNASFQGCAGSNAAELFYLLAPDPTGVVNGNVRDTAFIRRVSVGTMAHEFQHLISAERRLFVLDANSYDEEVWLNEGMSHIAEELTFYRSANYSPSGEPGQSPRADLTAQAIYDANAISPLAAFGFQNLARYSYYLASTETYSPYTENDSLETRGATWSFLRYTLDRAGSTDSALTYPLVNSPDTGLVNLATVIAAHGGTSAGVPLDTWFRDWAVANYADGLVSTASQYAQPSWDFRSVLTGFKLTDGTYFNGGIYPLATRTLANGTAQTLSLTGGGAAYFVFSVPAGSSAAVTVTGGGANALPTTTRLALVQTSGPNAGAVTTVDGPGNGAGTVSLANSSGAAINAALVVFNAAQPATSSQTVIVIGTSIAAPLGSVASSGASVAYTRGRVGPTIASLAGASFSASREPVMSDAAVMRRLQASSRVTLAPRAMAVRALYQHARRTGDFSAWAQQRYVPGTVKGLVVPVGAGTTGGGVVH